MALQLLIFDTRRGNTEGLEEDKVLAAFPNDVPLLHQSGMAGLLQGLLLFTANFTAALASVAATLLAAGRLPSCCAQFAACS